MKGERETLISFFPDMSQPGIKPTTCVCALTGNETCHLLEYKKMLKWSNTGQVKAGICFCLFFIFLFKETGFLSVQYNKRKYDVQ